MKLATENTVIMFYFIQVYYFKSLLWNQYVQMNTRPDLEFDKQGVCTDLESCFQDQMPRSEHVCLKSLSKPRYFPFIGLSTILHS